MPKDWTKLELFYKVEGSNVKLRLGNGTPCELHDLGTVCSDGVIRFFPSTIVKLFGIALPRMLVGALEKQEKFDG